jgi:hypothetical protein
LIVEEASKSGLFDPPVTQTLLKLATSYRRYNILVTALLEAHKVTYTAIEDRVLDQSDQNPSPHMMDERIRAEDEYRQTAQYFQKTQDDLLEHLRQLLDELQLR